MEFYHVFGLHEAAERYCTSNKKLTKRCPKRAYCQCHINRTCILQYIVITLVSYRNHTDNLRHCRQQSPTFVWMQKPRRCVWRLIQPTSEVLLYKLHSSANSPLGKTPHTLPWAKNIVFVLGYKTEGGTRWEKKKQLPKTRKWRKPCPTRAYLYRTIHPYILARNHTDNRWRRRRIHRLHTNFGCNRRYLKNRNYKEC